MPGHRDQTTAPVLASSVNFAANLSVRNPALVVWSKHRSYRRCDVLARFCSGQDRARVCAVILAQGAASAVWYTAEPRSQRTEVRYGLEVDIERVAADVRLRSIADLAA